MPRFFLFLYADLVPEARLACPPKACSAVMAFFRQLHCNGSGLKPDTEMPSPFGSRLCYDGYGNLVTTKNSRWLQVHLWLGIDGFLHTERRRILSRCLQKKKDTRRLKPSERLDSQKATTNVNQSCPPPVRTCMFVISVS